MGNIGLVLFFCSVHNLAKKTSTNIFLIRTSPRVHFGTKCRLLFLVYCFFDIPEFSARCKQKTIPGYCLARNFGPCTTFGHLRYLWLLFPPHFNLPLSVSNNFILLEIMFWLHSIILANLVKWNAQCTGRYRQANIGYCSLGLSDGHISKFQESARAKFGDSQQQITPSYYETAIWPQIFRVPRCLLRWYAMNLLCQEFKGDKWVAKFS